MITTIVLYGAKLTPVVTYYITNLSLIKDNLTEIKETKQGFNVYCNFSAGKRKQNDLKRNLKTFTGANDITFIKSGE